MNYDSDTILMFGEDLFIYKISFKIVKLRCNLLKLNQNRQYLVMGHIDLKVHKEKLKSVLLLHVEVLILVLTH